jgi:hypothetical protein
MDRSSTDPFVAMAHARSPEPRHADSALLPTRSFELDYRIVDRGSL